MASEAEVDMVSTAILALYQKAYASGYSDCGSDRKLQKDSAKSYRNTEFFRELELIDDVINVPFDIQHR